MKERAMARRDRRVRDGGAATGAAARGWLQRWCGRQPRAAVPDGNSRIVLRQSLR
jgi:hypothetical protein